MAHMNENILALPQNYLFAETAKRVNNYKKNNPDKKVIRMGIGDVTLPIPQCAVKAMIKGAEEMGVKETFRGYEDSGAGYPFLREAVSGYYKKLGAEVSPDDIRISDGAKSDCGNILDVFGKDNAVLITDPAYPVYVDSSLMGGHTVIYADSTPENGFAAMPPKDLHCDVIFLCSPNNPTGSVYTRAQLEEWVDYALHNKAVLIYDSAYEAFITDPDIPRSIYCIRGAEKCAVEICSLSKTAGFTGMRCGYTVVPEGISVYSSNGEAHSLKSLWSRRQGSKFNGVSYPVQCAAAAVFTEEGQRETAENIAYYRENSRIICEAMDRTGTEYTGGVNSPYIWFRCPNGMKSFDFFDLMLDKIQVAGTPGSGFGKNGEGWFRLTSFGTHEDTREAMARFEKFIGEI